MFNPALQISKDEFNIVRQPSEIVEHIHEQVLRLDDLASGVRRDKAELKLFPTECKGSRAFVVVDDIDGVDLSQTKPERIEVIIGC